MPAHVGEEPRNPAVRAVPAMWPSVPTRVMVYVASSGGVMSTPKAPRSGAVEADGDPAGNGDSGGVGEGKVDPEPPEVLHAEIRSRANHSHVERPKITSLNGGLYSRLRFGRRRRFANRFDFRYDPRSEAGRRPSPPERSSKGFQADGTLLSVLFLLLEE